MVDLETRVAAFAPSRRVPASALGPAASGRLLPLLGLAAGEQLIIMGATVGIAVVLSSTAFA